MRRKFFGGCRRPALSSTSRSAPLHFLGHHVSASGFAPLPSRVAAIQRYPRPVTVKQLLAFLGVFNFYRWFVPAAAKILRPLTDSTRGSPKAMAAVEWTPPMAAAFDAARTALGAAGLLAHPQQDQELAVMVDASADHVGAALQQRRSAAADWQPLAFFSKKLEPAQMRYSAFDREMFACVAGIRHFRYMRARLAGSRWPEHLPWVLLGLRTAADSGVSTAELVYGAALALPAEFLSTVEPAATDFLKKL
jgi:hypothetical protein